MARSRDQDLAPALWEVVNSASSDDVQDIAEKMLALGANPNYIGTPAGAGAIPCSTLMLAAQKNNPRLVRSLLMHGADVNFKDEKKAGAVTPVLDIVQQRLWEAFNVLAELGLLNRQSQDTLDHALWWAVTANQLAPTKALLAAGAKPIFRALADHQRGLLHYAVHHRNPEMIKLLISYGVNVNYCSNEGEFKQTALEYAASLRFWDTVIVIAEHRPISQSQSTLNSGLWYAVTENQLAAAQVLLSAGAKPVFHSIAAHKRGELHYAVQHRNLEMIKLLMNHGVDTNYCSIEGESKQTALEYAARLGFSDAVIAIAEHRPVTQSQDTLDSALWYAVTANQLAAAQVLLLAGAKPVLNSIADHRRGMLHYAVDHRNPEMIKLLMSHGVNVNYCSIEGESKQTALEFAAALGYWDLVIAIAEHRPISQSQRILDSVLWYAVEVNQLAAAKALLSGGAKPINIANVAHRRGTLHCAVAQRNSEMIKLLMNHGVDTNYCSIEGEFKLTALEFAARQDDWQSVTTIVEYWPSEQDRSAFGFLLWYALNANTIDSINAARKLLAAKANPNISLTAMDGNHYSVLHLAAYYKNRELYDLLLLFGANRDALDKHHKRASDYFEDHLISPAKGFASDTAQIVAAVADVKTVLTSAELKDNKDSKDNAWQGLRDKVEAAHRSLTAFSGVIVLHQGLRQPHTLFGKLQQNIGRDIAGHIELFLLGASRHDGFVSCKLYILSIQCLCQIITKHPVPDLPADELKALQVLTTVKTLDYKKKKSDLIKKVEGLARHKSSSTVKLFARLHLAVEPESSAVMFRPCREEVEKKPKEDIREEKYHADQRPPLISKQPQLTIAEQERIAATIDNLKNEITSSGCVWRWFTQNRKQQKINALTFFMQEAHKGRSRQEIIADIDSKPEYAQARSGMISTRVNDLLTSLARPLPRPGG